MTHDQGTGPMSATPVWVPQDDAPVPDAAPVHDAFGPVDGVTPRYSPAPPGAYPGYGYAAPPTWAPPPQSIPTIVVVGFVLVFVVPLAGLILSIIGLRRVQRTGEPGRRLAIAGVAIPAAWLVLGIVAAIVIPIGMNAQRKAEQGPRDAVVRLRDSIVDADCVSFLVGTTPTFQQEYGLTDCAAFDSFLAGNASARAAGELPIVDVDVDGDTATVTTLERTDWASYTPHEVDYTVIRTDGVWRVDEITYPD